MTDPVITWKLKADTQAEMTVNGQTFENVVTTVHWRVTAKDEASGDVATIYGSKDVPPPTDAQSYIDIADLQALETEERRTAVIGWAEAVEPGFLDAKIAQVTAQLEATLSAPQTASVSIL